MRWIVIVIAVLSRVARAEIDHADAIEWQTADAQLVAVGRVARVTTYADSAGVTWYRVHFAVRATLKGTPRTTVEFIARQSPGESPLDWRARDAELLVFLVEGKRRVTVHAGEYARAPFALRQSVRGDDEALDLGRPRAFTAGLQLLSTRAEIIAAVRRATRSRATVAELLELSSASHPDWLMPAGSTLWLHVPLDAPTEALAKRWIVSPDRDTQIAGARVLVHFPSAANAQLLLPMLGDRIVGAHVHRALVNWGVPHSTPPQR